MRGARPKRPRLAAAISPSLLHAPPLSLAHSLISMIYDVDVDVLMCIEYTHPDRHPQHTETQHHRHLQQLCVRLHACLEPPRSIFVYFLLGQVGRRDGCASGRLGRLKTQAEISHCKPLNASSSTCSNESQHPHCMGRPRRPARFSRASPLPCVLMSPAARPGAQPVRLTYPGKQPKPQLLLRTCNVGLCLSLLRAESLAQPDLLHQLLLIISFVRVTCSL